MTSDSILTIGRIQRPKGLKGDLRVIAFGNLLEEKNFYSHISFYEAKGSKDGFLHQAKLRKDIQNTEIVLASRQSEKIFTLRIQGIDSVEKAEKLKGLFLGIPLQVACQLAKRISDDPYFFEYVDAIVEDESKKEIGTVSRLETALPKELLYIRLYTGEEIPIPLDSPYLKKFDRQKQKVILTHFSDYLSGYLEND
ncbi:MAG: hypothetical protein D6767_08505 [Candidatus Hydrogenedentota bacterium]|nr:MAG: hypothetical protein D6767_08505 [Candidatus Hydrogenedentota bacterium]